MLVKLCAAVYGGSLADKSMKTHHELSGLSSTGGCLSPMSITRSGGCEAAGPQRTTAPAQESPGSQHQDMTKFLDENGAGYRVVVHPAAGTSHGVALAQGSRLEQGAKAIAFALVRGGAPHEYALAPKPVGGPSSATYTGVLRPPGRLFTLTRNLDGPDVGHPGAPERHRHTEPQLAYTIKRGLLQKL